MKWTYMVVLVLAGCYSGGQAIAGDAIFEAGFEQAEPGAVLTYKAAGGAWHAEPGHCEIHDEHRKSGRQALRLLGGEGRVVELRLDKPVQSHCVASFWSERWTARGPFRFRVEGRVNNQWVELYNGDETIRVGGFLTKVRFEVPKGTDRLRFQSTTPANSGVMIDDLRLAEARPMRVESVDTSQPVSPALVGNRTNPVALVVVNTVGTLEPTGLTSLRINTRGTTNLSDVESIEVYYTADNRRLSNNVPDANFPEDQRFGQPMKPAEHLTFRGEQKLLEGANHFWVSFKLKPGADIDGRLDAGCEWVRVAGASSEIVPQTVNPQGRQRMGVALRTAGDDGAKVYRIPGLATTNKGTLIAVYDIRYRGGGDLPGDIDVGMSRSADGGRTWQPMKRIMDMGDDPRFAYEGVGDPAVLVDRKTNTVWVAALWSHGNRGWHGSGPGLTPEETGQLLLVKSEDDGQTWSEPINITAQVKAPGWCLLLQGPGKGITMADGTLVFPAQYQDTRANGRVPHATVIYSKDRGETWHIGRGAYAQTTEAQVVELNEGELMLNARYNLQNHRVVRVSEDLGATWQDHPTTRSALIEPRACMASLINVDRELGQAYTGRLLFSNPDSVARRERMTIKASLDGGRTWPDNRRILLDEGISAGYSCMTMIDDKTVGILYEGNRAHMTFQRVRLDALFGPHEQVD
ncbi:MAG: exo-alpha-sialidase [Phycisphaeraceae bacterium]